jgi:hypothetical protein
MNPGKVYIIPTFTGYKQLIENVLEKEGLSGRKSDGYPLKEQPGVGGNPILPGIYPSYLAAGYQLRKRTSIPLSPVSTRVLKPLTSLNPLRPR